MLVLVGGALRADWRDMDLVLSETTEMAGSGEAIL
jgi:hypothetical protein